MQNSSTSIPDGVLGQFLRFAMVGVINSLVNFIILNLLSHFTGIKSGGGILGLGAIAFALATVNSYLLNKKFSFRDASRFNESRKFTMFLCVSLVGLLISSFTIFFITTYVKAPANLLTSIATALPVVGTKLMDTKVFWLNIANVVAICLALIWNFLGYRRFVFNRI